VHHGDAVGPEVDPRRPLSAVGQASVDRLADLTAKRGVRPDVFWHSGKLRAKQTAEAFWRACNALAEISASRDLQPGDPPAWMRDRLVGESRDVLIAGHFPQLAVFPLHGVVALRTEDDGATWMEEWRLD